MNEAGRAAGKAIAELLKTNKTLIHLRLECTDLDASDMREIAGGLENNKDLMRLDYDEGLLACCFFSSHAEAIERATHLNFLRKSRMGREDF